MSASACAFFAAALVAVQQAVRAQVLIGVERVANGLRTHAERRGRLTRAGAHIMNQLHDEQAATNGLAEINTSEQIPSW